MTEPPSVPSYADNRLAGMWSGPVVLLVADEELGDVEAAVVADTTVMLTACGDETGVLTGGGLSSYRPPFIVPHHVSPVADPPGLETVASTPSPICSPLS